MSGQVPFDEKATCNRCGCFGAYLFDGDKLCADCYQMRSACCPEFGQDDLWREKPNPCSKSPSCDGGANAR